MGRRFGRPSFVGVVSVVARSVLGGIALRRIAGAARTRPPVGATTTGSMPTISVVVPARDEATRIGALLDELRDAPGVAEVVVVDDESTDDTSSIAADAGAHVISGSSPPPGWAGKPWALQQGIEAASGEWIVALDADARPDSALPRALVARALEDATDLLTVGARYDLPSPGARWLHPALLTTLVYRFGPPGAEPRPPAERAMANGQCMVFRRAPMLASGAFAAVGGELVEDVALARHLAASGWSVDFLDASSLLTVRAYESLADTCQGWGRSIALPGVEPRARQMLDLAVVLTAQALPLARLLRRRADPVDLILLAARLGALAGTRSAYTRRSLSYWLSPLADIPAASVLAVGTFRRTATWRGRPLRTS